MEKYTTGVYKWKLNWIEFRKTEMKFYSKKINQKNGIKYTLSWNF